jgi:hypothetical protein
LEGYVRENARTRDKYATRMTSEGVWAAESPAGLRLPGLRPEGGATLYLRCMTGTLAYNKDRAVACPDLLAIRTHPQGPTLDTRCPLCLQAGEHHPGEDTVEHLFSECRSTDAARAALKSAIVGALTRVSQDQMPTGDALRVAASAVTARDFYAGQVPSHAKELLDDSCRRTQWKNDKGELIRYPVGAIHTVILTWAAELHARRRRLIYGDTLGTGLQPSGSLVTERADPGQGSREPEPGAEYHPGNHAWSA